MAKAMRDAKKSFDRKRNRGDEQGVVENFSSKLVAQN
jgi:hypothetical protein